MKHLLFVKCVTVIALAVSACESSGRSADVETDQRISTIVGLLERHHSGKVSQHWTFPQLEKQLSLLADSATPGLAREADQREGENIRWKILSLAIDHKKRRNIHDEFRTYLKGNYRSGTRMEEQLVIGIGRPGNEERYRRALEFMVLFPDPEERYPVDTSIRVLMFLGDYGNASTATLLSHLVKLSLNEPNVLLHVKISNLMTPLSRLRPSNLVLERLLECVDLGKHWRGSVAGQEAPEKSYRMYDPGKLVLGIVSDSNPYAPEWRKVVREFKASRQLTSTESALLMELRRR